MTPATSSTPPTPPPPAGYGHGWGAPGRATDRGAATHRPWSGILLAVHAVLAVLAVAGVCVGTVVAVIDLSDRSEQFDGLLAFVGFLLAGFSLLVGAGAVVLTVLTRKGRRRAEDGDLGLLRGMAIAALVLAAIAAMVQLSWLYAGIVHWSSSAAPLLVLLGMAPLALYVTAAIQTLRASRR